jgi:PPOX class probable FMN-dependent enzyme
MDFQNTVTSREQLREIYPEPNEAVVRKTIHRLDKHCATFIARSPFMIIASADASGSMDVSPKGDPEGFVKILDETTLAIPDRPGNHRADTLENILENPRVGLFFLIPGKTEQLRISGSARIVRDSALMDSMAVNNKSPALAIVVDIEEAFFHCSKCMVRSKLWQPGHWPRLEGLPRLADTMVDAGQLPISADDVHQLVLADEKERLY